MKFLVLSSAVIISISFFGVCFACSAADKTAWQCLNPSGALLYKGLKFKDIIDTYESEPSILVSTEDLTSKYLKGRMNSWDLSKGNLILNLEIGDITRVLTGPFVTSPVCQSRFQALITDFKELTGSSLKYVMIPLGTPRKLVQALYAANLSVIYHKNVIKHDTDLSTFAFRDYIVVDLSTQGLDLIMKIGKYFEVTDVKVFSLDICRSISLPRRDPDRTFFDLQTKLDSMNASVRSSRSNENYENYDRWYIRRDNVLEDSMTAWMTHSSTRFIGHTRISFVDEIGDDYGGLTKEWFALLARDGFGDSKYFDSLESDGKTYISPTLKSGADLEYFRFFGNIIAKVIINGHTIECNFPDFLLRMIMYKTPKFHDLKQLDPQSFDNNLIYLADADADVDLTFSYFRENAAGINEEVYLKPNGRFIDVNQENKYEYLRLLFNAKIHTPQVGSFIQGFRTYSPFGVPPLHYFKVDELRSFIAGQSIINVQEWKDNTEYVGFSGPYCAQATWFWEIVESFDAPQRRKLWKWISGSENPPLQGFASLRSANGGICKFKFIDMHESSGHLPRAHTCFNSLYMPVYNNKKQFLEKLLIAMNESESFAIV